MQIQTILSFILMFGALIFFHELGHLIFAKRAGILCREFAIGMGPKILSFKKKETQYTLRLLPIGGYVKMAGEDPEQFELNPGQQIAFLLNDAGAITKIITNHFDKYPQALSLEVEDADLEKELFIRGVNASEESVTYPVDPNAMTVEDGVETQIAPWNRQFHSKTIPQRALAIVAGPMMNFILAILLFIAIGFIQGLPSDKPIVGDVFPGSAAQKAGLVKGTVIKSVNGISVSKWEDLVQNIRKSPGIETDLVVREPGSLTNKTVTVTPKPVKIDNTQEVGQIGISMGMERSPGKVLSYGFTETWNWCVRIVDSVGKLITGQFAVKDLSGPVGIYAATEQVVRNGFAMMLSWTAILSINLGIMNLLPLPALDGGRLLFFAVEALRGKPIDREKEGMVHFIGFALLMLLMVFVTWNDIQRLFF